MYILRELRPFFAVSALTRSIWNTMRTQAGKDFNQKYRVAATFFESRAFVQFSSLGLRNSS